MPHAKKVNGRKPADFFHSREEPADSSTASDQMLVIFRCTGMASAPETAQTVSTARRDY
jgi:hypothetical protein